VGDIPRCKRSRANEIIPRKSWKRSRESVSVPKALVAAGRWPVAADRRGAARFPAPPRGCARVCRTLPFSGSSLFTLLTSKGKKKSVENGRIQTISVVYSHLFAPLSENPLHSYTLRLKISPSCATPLVVKLDRTGGGAQGKAHNISYMWVNDIEVKIGCITGVNVMTCWTHNQVYHRGARSNKHLKQSVFIGGGGGHASNFRKFEKRGRYDYVALMTVTQKSSFCFRFEFQIVYVILF